MKHDEWIYKRTATGAIQQWKQEISGSRYRTLSGQVDGAIVTGGWVQAEATNAGRANERTPEEQAVFEVDSNYRKKLERDYHESIEDVDDAKIFSPMLAKEYGKHLKKIELGDPEFLLYSQPKLDGMRCIATSAGLFSRNGKPIVACPHVHKTLLPLFEENEDLVLDGELYNHDLKDDFNAIISACRKLKPSAEDLAASRDLIQYHVYDVPSSTFGFARRSEHLSSLRKSLRDLMGHIQFVKTDLIIDEGHLDEVYAYYLDQGYEGQMVRTDAPYQNKRSADLLKRKESMSDEFELIDLEPGLGNWAGKAKRAILKGSNGEPFKAGVTGTQEFCAEILQRKTEVIGSRCTVEFFSYTPDGVPRFGRVKEFSRKDV